MRIVWVAFVLGTVGCLRAGASHVKSDLDNRPTISLGQGYYFPTDQFLAQPCFDTSQAILPALPPKDAVGEFTTNLSYKALTNKLAAGGQVAVAGSDAGIDARGSYARINAQNNYVSTLTYILRYSEAYQQLDLNKVTLGSTAKQLAAAGASTAERASTCGTDIVVGKKLHFLLTATIKIEFKSAINKQNFDASMSLSSDGMALFGKIMSSQAGLNDDVIITINALQQGGDSTQLARILSADLGTCDSNHRSECVAAMKRVVDYGQDVQKQFSRSDGSVDYGALALDTYVQAKSDLVPNWSAEQPTDLQRTQIAAGRDLIRLTINDATVLSERAATLLTIPTLSDAQTAAIQNVDHISMARKQHALEIKGDCYPPQITALSGGKCSASANQLLSDIRSQPQFQVNYDDLIIIPSGFKPYCEMLQSWYNLVRVPDGTGEQGAAQLAKYRSQIDAIKAAGEQVLNAKTRNAVLAMLNMNGVKTTKPVSSELTPDANSFAPSDINCADYADRVYQLRSANLSNALLEDLTPVVSLASAVVLDLSGNNNISDLSPVAKIRGLKALMLAGTNIDPGAFVALRRLKDLRLLDLSQAVYLDSSQTDILFSISGLKRLQYLSLEFDSKAISSLDLFGDVPNLIELNLNGLGINIPAFEAWLQGSRASDQKPRLAQDFTSLARVVNGADCTSLVASPAVPTHQVHMSCVVQTEYSKIAANYVVQSGG